MPNNVDYTIMPIVLINNYIWGLATGSVSGVSPVASAVWDTSVYAYRPFFPINENLAPDSSKMPYILYDYIFRDTPESTLYAIYKEEATYTIVGDMPQIFYLKNYIFDQLNNMDVSAREINQYSATNQINFKYIDCYQDNFSVDEKRIDSYKPKYITTLKIVYEYTR
jgi:hypothetical protein